MRRLRWDVWTGRGAAPKRPFRDSALLYGSLAVLVVVIAVATGGDVVRAVIAAGAAFAAAMAFTWWRWRAKLGSQEEKQ